MRSLAAILLAILCLAGPTAAAARASGPVCPDVFGQDFCDADRMAARHGRFDVPTAEVLAGQGFEGVRVFWVDGFSRDLPLVSVLRPPGAAARLDVRIPTDAAPRVMDQPTSPWTWEVSQTLARMALAAPEAVSEDQMCLHAWSARIEVIAGGKVTTRVRSLCSGDALFEGADALSVRALDVMPGCDGLLGRTWADRLATCSIIGGQKSWDAVEVANLLQGRVFEDYPPDEAASVDEDIPRSDVSRMFGPNATMAWAGSPPVKGPDAAADLWRRKLNDETFLRIEPRSIEAGPYTVIVRGVISYSESPDDKPAQRFEAPFEQRWLRFNGYELRIFHWSVEPFRPAAR